MKKYLFLLILTLSVSVYHAQDVVINEFLASNSTIAADQEGEYDDWVELYNNSTVEIDLSGWYLTDTEEVQDKWTFPALTIQPGEYLIIWTDNDEEQGSDHANFKLSMSGEEIVLSDAGLNVIDQISFGAQLTDISMGRFPDATGEFTQLIPSFMSINTEEYSPEGDPSEQLFTEDIVQNFNLHFYTENWADSLEYYYNNGEEYIPAMLTYNDTIVLDSIGVRYKGNSSYMQSSTTPKKPLKFHFGKYIDDQLLCGMEKLNFSNCVKDPSFMREVIGYQIIGQYIPSPRTAYANVSVDNDLLGFYVQVEQIDEFFITRHYDENIGDLYKAGDDGATMLYRGDVMSDYEDEFELKTNEDENDWNSLITLLDNLNNCSDEAFYDTMDGMLNLDQCAVMLAYNMVLSHFDSYTGSGRNFYLYQNTTTARFEFLPWDLNETFGAYSNNWDVISQDVLDMSNFDERPLSKRLLENETLKELYLYYIEEMIGGAASYDSISLKIADLQDFIDPYIQADTNKLYSYDDFIRNIDEDVNLGMGNIIPGLRSFSQSRNDNIMQQLSYTDVYPGDCDNNGIVDEFDLLPIGLYFLMQGNPRIEVSFLWQDNLTAPWDDAGATYADANGDGVIDERDVIGIGVNWGNSHTVYGASQEVDISNNILLEAAKEKFRQIYNSLQGDSGSICRMRALLESIYGFENIPPEVTSYLKNYPNPFNPVTTISFGITDGSAQTELAIYNLKGQKIITLLDERLAEGEYSLSWDGIDEGGESLASGIYFSRLKNGDKVVVNRMVLMK
jgi:CotH kinase protein/Lamin Tail Domain/FlgD Ig-like domain